MLLELMDELDVSATRPDDRRHDARSATRGQRLAVGVLAPRIRQLRRADAVACGAFISGLAEWLWRTRKSVHGECSSLSPTWSRAAEPCHSTWCTVAGLAGRFRCVKGWRASTAAAVAMELTSSPIASSRRKRLWRHPRSLDAAVRWRMPRGLVKIALSERDGVVHGYCRTSNPRLR